MIENTANRARDAVVPRATSWLDGIIFHGLLIIIALTAIPYGTVEVWWVSLFECLVFAIAILAIIQMTIDRRWQLTGVRLAVPLLLLTLFVVFQSLPIFPLSGLIGSRALSADPYGTRLFAMQLFALIGAGLLLLRYTSSKARLRKLVYVVIGVAVASAVFGIMRTNLQQGPGFLLPRLGIDGRGFGQFINKNHFALLMEMALGLSLGLIVGELTRVRRVLLLLFISGLLWTALIYSNSRGGIIASLCQLLFLGVMRDPVRRLTGQRVRTNWDRLRNIAGGFALRIFLIACLVGLFAYGVGWMGGEPVVTNFQLAASDFTQQEMLNNANTSRKEIWATTWKLIKANPITGVGFSGYWIGITKYHNASGELTPQQAHNDYLELLASGGLIGAALVLWFVAGFLGQVRTRWRSLDPYYRAACLGALTGIFGVAIHSAVDFGLHITINAVVLVALIVIAVQSSQAEHAVPQD